MPNLLPSVFLALSVVAAVGCSRPGRAKAALAEHGTIEASWSGGRDESRSRAIEFVLVRNGKQLDAYAISTYDDGREESMPIGYIDDRCVMVKQPNTDNMLWPDGPGRIRFVNMGPIEKIPTDCGEYRGTPGQRFVPSALGAP